MPPRGFHNLARSMPSEVIQIFIYQLYKDVPEPSKPRTEKTPLRTERNQEIRRRFSDGEDTMSLARDFGVSRKRIYQIIQEHRR